jgi:hypothetical protein
VNEDTDPRLRHYEQKLAGLRQAIAWFLGMLPWFILALFAAYVIIHWIIASLIGSFVPVPDSY